MNDSTESKPTVHPIKSVQKKTGWTTPIPVIKSPARRRERTLNSQAPSDFYMRPPLIDYCVLLLVLLFFSLPPTCEIFILLLLCLPSDNVVLKKTEQKVQNYPEQEGGSIIRQFKTDVMHMKTTTTNIPPCHPPK